MIHTGERPYACEFCNRGFYRKDKLSRHRKIHLNPSSRTSRGSKQSHITTTVANPMTVASMSSPNSATIQLIPLQVSPQFLTQSGDQLATLQMTETAPSTNKKQLARERELIN